MHQILAFISLLVSCYFLIRLLRPTDIPESILVFYCVFTAHVIGIGYALSFLSRLGDISSWSRAGIIAAIISVAVAVWKRRLLPSKVDYPAFKRAIQDAKNRYIRDITPFENLLLIPLGLTTLLLGLLNLATVVFSAPHHWDSLTYHLARMAYYLQHGNVNYFGANYWAQVIHPKNSTLLLLYTYQIAGRNENITQSAQYVSYWVAACAVYAISAKAWKSKIQGLFSALICALLTEWLMQATTTQNDLILTAYLGATVYFLIAFKETHKQKYLLLAALGIGLSAGTKASAFLFLIPLALIALYALFQDKTKVKLNFIILSSSALFAICLFALPAGYLENYRRYGHPIGPRNVREIHSFEGASIGYIFRNGTKNLARFGVEFLSLDGMPQVDIVQKAQTFIRLYPKKIMTGLGIDLGAPTGTRVPFDYDKIPVAQEDGSYWGIFGFSLVWIAVFLSIVGAIKSSDIRVLSLAAILFIFTQAYTGPYDPWRGRYFTAAAIFALPAVGAALQTRHRLLRIYLTLVVFMGCASAISAVILRNNSALISIHYQDLNAKSIFAMDRLEQLVRNGPAYYEPLKKFEELTPKDATVAVFLEEDSFEYPLFGERLTRTIIPINSFDKGLQPIPANAEYLLYAPIFPCANTRTDIYLGGNWYLRQLTDKNRDCP